VSSAVEKVVAHLIQGGEIAVFIHLTDEDPPAAVRPAGASSHLHDGEDPASAAMPEAREETGLHGLRIVRYLGDTYYDKRPYADQLQHRISHLASDKPPLSTWDHDEPDEGAGPPRPFRFSWLDITKAHVLAAGQGALLGQLGRRGPRPAQGRRTRR